MNDSATIAPIVEGDGEVQAVPVLIRKICGEILGRYDINVRKPWKLPRGKMTKPGELAKVVDVVSRSISDVGGILIVLDLDDDECIVDLAKSLEHQEKYECKIKAVVAAREYEAWLLGAVASLSTHRCIRDDALYEGDPELPRDAKGRLEGMMKEKYRETLHQAAFTELLDLSMAQSSSRSFRRMISALTQLLE